jgi:hypothetical protein
VGERRGAGDVADGPEVLGPDHPAVLIDLDPLPRVEVQPQRFQAQSGGTGPAARGQDHPVGVDSIATGQGQPGATLGGLRRRHPVAEQHPDTDGGEPLGRRRRRLWLLARDQPGVALDDGGLGAEDGEEIGELASDRPPADDGDRPGLLAGAHCLLAGPGRHGVQARHLGSKRCRARVQDEIAVPDPGAVDLHDPGLHDAPRPAQQPRPRTRALRSIALLGTHA